MSERATTRQVHFDSSSNCDRLLFVKTAVATEYWTEVFLPCMVLEVPDAYRLGADGVESTPDGLSGSALARPNHRLSSARRW